MTIVFIEKFIAWCFIFILAFCQFAIISQWNYNYNQQHGLIEGFAIGMKGSSETQLQYSKPGSVGAWENGYWFTLIILSIIAIGIPFTITILKLRLKNMLWLNLLWYLTLILFSTVLILKSGEIFWRFSWYNPGCNDCVF